MQNFVMLVSSSSFRCCWLRCFSQRYFDYIRKRHLHQIWHYLCRRARIGRVCGRNRFWLFDGHHMSETINRRNDNRLRGRSTLYTSILYNNSWKHPTSWPTHHPSEE